MRACARPVEATSVSYLFLDLSPSLLSVGTLWEVGNTYKLGLINHGRDDKLGTPNTLIESPPMQLCLNLSAARAGRLHLLAHSRESSSSSDKLRK